jgi:uncharacterized surface protein with fasciclin (FAS1) repeats
MKTFNLFVVAGTIALQSIGIVPSAYAQNHLVSKRALLVASKTVQFKEKEGFERRKKDIINTLKDNDVTQFSILLDGLDQAFALDNTLKSNGPFTLFAPNDKAFKKLPDDDRASLWANKKKLKQVLQYHIVRGLYNGASLRKETKLKTEEGHSITLSTRGDDVSVDKAVVTVTDINCTNGVIHVIDDVIMPPLSKSKLWRLACPAT